MMVRSIVVVFGLVVVMASGEDLLAQTQSLTGGRTTGNAAAGGGGGQSALGQGNVATGFGQQAGGGQAGFGQAAGGQAGFGQAGAGQGLVGRNDNATRFVGRSDVGTQGGQAVRSQSIQNRSSRNANSQPGRGGSARNLRVVRPRLRIAFTAPPRAETAVRESLQSTMELASQSRQWNGIDWQIGPDQQVTLRGQVATPEDARLLAALARLEPGVRKVTSELTVGDPE